MGSTALEKFAEELTILKYGDIHSQTLFIRKIGGLILEGQYKPFHWTEQYKSFFSFLDVGAHLSAAECLVPKECRILVILEEQKDTRYLVKLNYIKINMGLPACEGPTSGTALAQACFEAYVYLKESDDATDS